MERRDVLKVAASLAATGALSPTKVNAAQPARRAPAAPASRPYIGLRDGERIFLRDWGTGAPIVFLAAWALPSDMWSYQMVPLCEQGMRCVAYDRRGHGRSSDSGRGFDYDTLADDLATVLDTLDLRDVTLVGMSMASGEMVRYLTRHGAKRIARLVFVAPSATPFPTRTPDNPGGIPAERFDAFRRILLRDYPLWLEDNRTAFFVPETSPQIQEWVRMLMLSNSLKAIIDCSRIMTSTDFRAELPTISIPSLVIHGDKDTSAPLDLMGRPTAKMIPGAQLTVYEGAPHGLFVTHMTRLTSDVLAFAKS
jgi:pimeloyl-ACP methyl ester carboxylesterase